jgi:hypothetical protein
LNNSYCKWLPWLRDEMQQTYGGNVLALVSGVVKRWTSTWLSAISVLRVKVSTQKLMLSGYAAQEFEKVEKSNTANAKSVLEVKSIIGDAYF